MGKKIDLTGQRFGRLVVLGESSERIGNKKQFGWRCLCDCGNEKTILTNRFKSGRTKSCGCLQKESAVKNGRTQVIDITGGRFGKLVAIKPTDERYRAYVKWLCKCDCGNESKVVISELLKGRTNSCGCLQKEKAVKLGRSCALDVTGERFGRLLAIKPTSERDGSSIKWLFKCDCGNEKIISVKAAKNGTAKSCGCLSKELNINKISFSQRRQYIHENLPSH
jgi:hypothetical protein